MECLWRLFSHRQPDGDCYQQNPPVFYVHFVTDNGLADYHLHGAGFLEKYAEVYLGGEEKSVVLFVINYSSLKSTPST